MNRTDKFIKNILMSSLLQLFTIIFGFLTPRIIISYYGSEINGLISSITQFILYFSLVEAGLSGAAIFHLYKPLADTNTSKINIILATVKKLYTKSGYIFLSLLLGLSIIYPYFISTKSLNYIDISFLILIIGANGIFEFFTVAKYRVLLIADQKSFMISFATILQLILNFSIIYIFSFLSISIVMVKLIALLSILLRSFIIYVYVKKRYKYLKIEEVKNYSEINTKNDVLYHQIIGLLQKSSPLILATFYVNLITISIFAIYNVVILALDGIINILTSNLLSPFGQMISKNEYSKLIELYNIFEFAFYSFITLLYSISLILFYPFINLYTRNITELNYIIPNLGYLMLINAYLFFLKTPQGLITIAAGKFKETKFQATIQMFILLISTFIFAPIYGIIGIVLASILSNFYRVIDLIIFSSRHFIFCDFFRTIKRIILSIIQILVIIIPFYNTSQGNIDFIDWFEILIQSSLYGLVVIVVFTLIFDFNALKNIFVKVKNYGGKYGKNI